MPTYEYLCQTCSHRFETWQKMTDEPLTTCPECGSPIHRVLFPAGIVFKGHGFYKTDHSSNGSPSASSDGDHKKAEAGSNGDAKKAETGSNGDAKKAESNTSSSTGTSESKSTTTTTATK